MLKRAGSFVAAGALVAAAAVAAPVGARDPGSPRVVETAAPGVVHELPAVAVDCRGDQQGAEIDPEQLTPRATEPVLLVHGTGVNGDENYRWALAEHLHAQGLSACWFDYPERGMVDQQRSGEATAAALLRLSEATSAHPSAGAVDVLGHSQGAVLPRWATRWFPDARAAVDDMVLLAGPAHGTTAVELHGLVPGAGCGRSGGFCSQSMWQFSPRSAFIEALNRGGDTFESIDYTNIYSLFDELVRHGAATGDPRREVEASSALGDGDPSTANVRNVLLQDLCPGRPVDHATIFIDSLMAKLAVDAFVNDGPSATRATPVDCASLVFTDAAPAVLPTILSESFNGGFPDWSRSTAEPPLRHYAQP